MPKPQSIVRFERFYWASVLIGLVNTVLNWGASRAALATNPMLADATWLLPVMQLVGFGISILLWVFIVRRPSVVAKWVLVVFAAFGAFGLLSALFLLVLGRVPVGVQLFLGLATNILYIAAAAMLFRPDAKLWLGEGLDEDDDLTDAPRA
jgi:hypothetical protein